MDQINFLSEKIIISIDNKSSDIENSLSIVNTYGKDSAARLVNAKIGKAHMDTLRILIDDLVSRERAFLSQQNERLAHNTRMEDAVRFFAFGVVGLTSLMALLAIARRQKSIQVLVGDLNKANEELEQKVVERTRQLVEANKAKDHFLAIASHDLKVPLAGVSRIVELMKLNDTNRSANEIEYLDMIQASCGNMQQLITNLLDISRIERKELTAVNQEVDLSPLLTELWKDFSLQAEKKDIKFILDNAVAGMILADPDILKRILENLISNAIKFSPADTTVQVSVKRDNGNIEFRILDKGPGIPADEIPNLFKKFQRRTNKPSGGEDSTGLGLSIVKELVDLLGGKLTVVSKVNEGSIFTVSMPA